MSRRKVNRVGYPLDSGGIKDLPLAEIKAILRGADPLIMTGGRNLLSKILKGSKDKKVLAYELDRCPAYGFFKDLTIEEITAKIDWVIENGYLEIRYDYRLPLLAFTEEGWEIEKDTFADELLEELRKRLASGNFSYINDLKDRNRGLILLLLDKIKATGDPRFIPLLHTWEKIDYQKVQKAIREVITALSLTRQDGIEKKVINLEEYRRTHVLSSKS